MLHHRSESWIALGCWLSCFTVRGEREMIVPGNTPPKNTPQIPPHTPPQILHKYFTNAPQIQWHLRWVYPGLVVLLMLCLLLGKLAFTIKKNTKPFCNNANAALVRQPYQTKRRHYFTISLTCDTYVHVPAPLTHVGGIWESPPTTERCEQCPHCGPQYNPAVP